MKSLALGILGSGKGTNCRAILERIRSRVLPAEARVVISDVLDAPILDIAREFSIPNAYLPPGRFRTRLEPQAEMELVRMLRDAGVELVISTSHFKYSSSTPAKISWARSVETSARRWRKSNRLHRPLCR